MWRRRFVVYVNVPSIVSVFTYNIWEDGDYCLQHYLLMIFSLSSLFSLRLSFEQVFCIVDSFFWTINSTLPFIHTKIVNDVSSDHTFLSPSTCVLHYDCRPLSCAVSGRLTGDECKEAALNLMPELLLPLATVGCSRIEASAYHSMSDTTPMFYYRNTVTRKSLW